MRGPPITERKTRLDGTHEDFTCERLLLEPGKRAVLRYELDRAWRVADGALVLPKGTVTIAHYWMDRPYNVYHWVAGSRASGAAAPRGGAEGDRREEGSAGFERLGTLAYYCNVAEPNEISEELVAYTDLVVDVLVDRAGKATVLDEDELPADLSPARRGMVARALDDLLSHPRRLAGHIEEESRPFLGAG